MSLSDSPIDPASPRHLSVMVREVLEYLAPSASQIVVDATAGAGGHSREIASRLGPDGLLVCIDRDPSMLEIARRRVAGVRAEWVVAGFSNLRAVLDERNIERVDGVLMDLGVASDQIDDGRRGFSFRSSGPLDMRMNPTIGEPASRLVNELPGDALADLFYRYGEERRSRRVARAIVDARQHHRITTTDELANIVRRSLPRGRSWQRIDPATRVFQALRIAVNDELTELELALAALPNCLRPGGRAVVISFHSLEDRLVKQSFRRSEWWEVLTKKPRTPSDAEVEQNPRSRSAKLRAAQRVSIDPVTT